MPILLPTHAKEEARRQIRRKKLSGKYACGGSTAPMELFHFAGSGEEQRLSAVLKAAEVDNLLSCAAIAFLGFAYGTIRQMGQFFSRVPRADCKLPVFGFINLPPSVAS